MKYTMQKVRGGIYRMACFSASDTRKGDSPLIRTQIEIHVHCIARKLTVRHIRTCTCMCTSMEGHFKFIIDVYWISARCNVYIHACAYKQESCIKSFSSIQEPRINVFYSTPSRYLDAVHQAGLSWSVKEDDFFPYADAPWSYWTGTYAMHLVTSNLYIYWVAVMLHVHAL